MIFSFLFSFYFFFFWIHVALLDWNLEIGNKIGSSWFHSDELEMEGTATMVPRREPLKGVQVHQVSVSFEHNFLCGFYFFYVFSKYISKYIKFCFNFNL